MEKDTEVTKVIFRKEDDGEILAVFPALIAQPHSNYCSCYAHVGQHSSMMVDYFYNTKPVHNPAEYADLKVELESLGYNLKVYKRMSRKDFEARENALI